MDIKKVLMAGLFVVPSVNAEPTVSGAFVGLTVGGSHVSVKEYFRENGKTAKDQKEGFAPSGNGFYCGGELGGGYSFNGVYVGAKIYLHWNATEAKLSESNKKVTKSLLLGESKEAVSLAGTANVSIRPRFEYGAAVLLGGQIAPSAIAYLSFGVEGAAAKISQSFALANSDYTKGIFLNNDLDTQYTYESASNFTGNNPVVSPTKVTPPKQDPIKQTLWSIVPGVGFKYFFDSGVFLGADVNIAIGLNSNVDQKYFNKNATYTGTGPAAANGAAGAAVSAEIPSISAQKITLHIKKGLGIRYGVCIGYKF
ncbi:MAG: hypothetical protein LBD36_01490 [Holosporales bacterium]|jgi:hypothetical protein|nr:hypothetical protein [Holosporales bacterium]